MYVKHFSALTFIGKNKRITTIYAVISDDSIVTGSLGVCLFVCYIFIDVLIFFRWG